MHKAVDVGERYDLAVGITDPKEVEIFRSIIAPLVLKERNLAMEKGELRVEELASSTASFEDLVKSAGRTKSRVLIFSSSRRPASSTKTPRSMRCSRTERRSFTRCCPSGTQSARKS